MPAPFACDMTAVVPEERRAHHALIRRLMTEAVEEISELPEGLDFRLDVAPDRAPLRLRLTGAEGAKDFIRAELGLAR